MLNPDNYQNKVIEISFIDGNPVGIVARMFIKNGFVCQTEFAVRVNGIDVFRSALLSAAIHQYNQIKGA